MQEEVRFGEGFSGWKLVKKCLIDPSTPVALTWNLEDSSVSRYTPCSLQGRGRLGKGCTLSPVAQLVISIAEHRAQGSCVLVLCYPPPDTRINFRLLAESTKCTWAPRFLEEAGLSLAGLLQTPKERT